jgi:CTD small phosphatase-like protein 2
MQQQISKENPLPHIETCSQKFHVKLTASAPLTKLRGENFSSTLLELEKPNLPCRSLKRFSLTEGNTGITELADSNERNTPVHACILREKCFEPRFYKSCVYQEPVGMDQNISVDSISTESSPITVKPDLEADPIAAMPFRNLLFSPNITADLLRQHLKYLKQDLVYCTKNLKVPDMSVITPRQISLRVRSAGGSQKKCLVLDLDETLITTIAVDASKPDKVVKVTSVNGSRNLNLKIRPYAKQFLENLKEHFEIIIFTASTADYASAIINELDPTRDSVSYILDRKYCLQTQLGNYIKDLRILKNRKLKDIVIVDNRIHSFGFQINNGIPILEWTGNKEDTELQFLEQYLLKLAKCENIPDFNEANLKLLDLADTDITDI